MPLARDVNKDLVQAMRPVDALSTVLAVGAASVASSSVFTKTVIRVVSTTDCWIEIGPAPTAAAAAGSIFFPASVVEYFGVTPGSDLIAVIQASASGSLSVAEMD